MVCHEMAVSRNGYIYYSIKQINDYVREIRNWDLPRKRRKDTQSQKQRLVILKLNSQ